MSSEDVTEELPLPHQNGPQIGKCDGPRADQSTDQDNDQDDARVVAAVKQYMRLLESGQAPPIDQYMAKHAEIADGLRPALEGLAIVYRAEPAREKLLEIVAPDSEFTAKPIGDFQIVSEIGRGGMGVVYEAIQLSLGRRVALKVLPFASGLDEVRLQRFRNEAHAAAALHHTHIVPVYAVGSDRGIHYYAMQLIDGRTLGDYVDSVKQERSSGTRETRKGLRSSTVPIASGTMAFTSGQPNRGHVGSMVRMTVQAALALEYAHGYGIVHRDIKPANLLLDSVGKLWVTDFGLAQVQDAASSLTRTGDPMGTLRYMSPEQAAGNRAVLDHRTDIYSLGVTLYELVTLHPAIRGTGYREMLNEIAEQEPVAPRSIEPSLPIELDTIIRKAIAKSPSDRYASARAFADDLQSWLDDKPIKAKPPTILERLAKWRRRNSGLVAVATGMLLLATLALSATTLMVWREQRATQAALSRETEQRRLAERNFQQARSAVDTFSNLSESELAYRSDLQDLRRSFLETSLEFYRDFLSVRSNTPALATELAATSTRVEKMVNELRILDNLSPLMQLENPDVQRELAVTADQAAGIIEAIAIFHGERRALVNQNPSGLSSENSEMTSLLSDFDSFVSAELGAEQLIRLRQIDRQGQLPFTFKTSEVVTALALTRQQVTDINRIIEETRPGRGEGFGGFGFMAQAGPPRGNEDERRGPQGGSLRSFGPGNRIGPPGGQGGPQGGPGGLQGGQGGSQRIPGIGPQRGPGDLLGGPPRGPTGSPGGRPFTGPGGRQGEGRGEGLGNPFRRDDSRPPRPMSRSPATQNTVKHILDVLTVEQRQKWGELIGEPFNP